MALTNNTTIKPVGQDAIAKALEADPSKLQSYWDSNPDALQTAVKSDPGAFTLTGLKQSTQQPATNQPQQTSSLSNIGTPSTTSVQQGGQSQPTPTLAQSASQTVVDPFKALESGGMIDQVGLIRLLHFSPGEVQRKIVNGDIQLTQSASQHFYDNIMANRAKQEERLSSQSPAAQRYAERYLNDPLNQGVVDYHLNTYGSGGSTPPPSGGGTTQPPTSQPPAGGGGQVQPPYSGGDIYQPPSGGGYQPPSSDGGTYQPPSGGTGNQSGQPSGGGQGAPVYDGGYQTPYKTPQPYTTGNAGLDAKAVEFINKLNNGSLSFDQLSENDKALVLQGLNQAVASNPQGWNNIQNEELRNAYINRWGDPQEGVVGAEQNTTTPWGNVQGQWNAEEGGAYQAAGTERQVGNKELASWQLNDLLATGSPLMTLARQQAADQAERSGMRNSSLAAGAAQAAMAERMMPLAQQNAQTEAQASSQNQALEMERRLSNAAMGNDLMNADRQRDYGYNLQQLAGDQDFAKQNLAGQKAADLANIEGQYKMLISENDSAARIFQSTYDSIAQILSNHELDADEAGEKADYLVSMMESMMESLLAFENFDLDGSGPAGGSQATLPASVQEMMDSGGRFQAYS